MFPSGSPFRSERNAARVAYMSWSRRSLLTGAAATGALCAGDSLASPLRRRHAKAAAHPARRAKVQPRVAASVAPTLTPDLVDSSIVTTAPTSAHLDPKGLIRKSLLNDAMVALKRHAARIPNQDHVFIVDFSIHSSKPRLYRLDLRSGEVEAFRTAHGRGSDPTRTGFAERFSNTPNSNASSVGAYLTAGQSAGARDGANVLLDGLDRSNSQARERAIIVHGADYCQPDYLAREGMLGRSNGCFALSHGDLALLRPLMDAGRLLYADI